MKKIRKSIGKLIQRVKTELREILWGATEVLAATIYVSL